jgi:uncharacterized protein YecE (DUF72 family)
MTSRSHALKAHSVMDDLRPYVGDLSERCDLIRIGCAGWSLRSAQLGLFGEGDSHLARYATRFNAVEINSSFYRSHQRRTYERWAASVPEDFHFSVKLPKAITHQARLVDTQRLIDQFTAEVIGLGKQLGGLLVQLPPSLPFNAIVATTFFSALRERLDAPIACEPRHGSWFVPEVNELWRSLGVTRVAADPPRVADGGHPEGSAPWSYWRWHGTPHVYYSSYAEADLRDLAATLRSTAYSGRRAWCIFDNTALGHAITNAIRLLDLCVDSRLQASAS